MFIPNDQVLLAAMEADCTLAQEVERKRVVIATPMNLMALLRIIALGWRQEALAENAREIESLGRELYTRLSVFAAKLETLGKRVGALVRGYNDAIASFESRVLPSARRMAKLGTVAANQELPTAEPITLVPRELRAQDLTLRLRWRSVRAKAMSSCQAGIRSRQHAVQDRMEQRAQPPCYGLLAYRPAGTVVR